MIRIIFTALFFVSAALPADRVTGVVDNSRVTRIRATGHPGALAGGEIGALEMTRRIEYATLQLTPAAGLEAFLTELQTPSSPNYQKFLTPRQVGERFGLSSNDLGKVNDWLRSQGLTVHDVAQGRLWVTFSGTVGQVNRAFRTDLRRYRVDGETHFANATGISVPTALAAVVSGVRGLDDFELAPQHHVYSQMDPHFNSGTRHYLSPDDLATIYNFAPLWNAGIDGTGQKIAVIGRTNINMSDMQAFRRRFNMPQNDPQVVLFGPDPGISQGDLLEANLDLQWAGAVARNATVIYVNSRSVLTSAQYAIDQNLAPVMTMSYGGCEATTTDNTRTIAQQGAAQGITWMISSGDSGAATCDRSTPTPLATKGATVAYPASIPEVTAVGGTEFNEGSGNYWDVVNGPNRGSALGYIPERVWNDTEGATNVNHSAGGGMSRLYAKPPWQTGPGVPNDGVRDVPDISLTASASHVGYQVIYNGGLTIVGGTSASSPAFAGIVAMLNQKLAGEDPKAPVGLGNINPALYRLAQAAPEAFHDTTVGDNMVPCAQGTPDCVEGKVGYPATVGYDLASGLGSVDALKLLEKWGAGSVSSITLRATPASIAFGDALKLTATVTGAGAAPTGNVTFATGDAVLGSVALSGSGTAELSPDSAIVARGTGAITASYAGDANFRGSSGNVTVPLKLPASASYLLPSVTPNPVRQSGGVFPYELRLVEKAGVATKITAFTVNNVNNMSLLANQDIAASGTLTLALSSSAVVPPLNRVFHFEGVDTTGATWTRAISVPFLGPVGNLIRPAIALAVTPVTVQQNPQADPACQWQLQVTVQETTGFAVTLSSFTAAGTSLTSNISQLFGTNRLAPFGMLTATVCLSNLTVPATRTVTVAGLTETSGTVTATANVNFTANPPSTADFTVSANSVALQKGVESSTLELKFGAGTPAWTATTLQPGVPKWLTLGSTTGTGPGTLTLNASAAGLSSGVYNALVAISASGTLPQSIMVPVTFTVGGSALVSISGVSNAASGTRTFAPGMLMGVYGRNLARAAQIASRQPLPVAMSAVSATVNGVAAPLWFVSPEQINLQIPYETSSGQAVLAINNGGLVTSFTFTVKPTAPGVFIDVSDGFMVPVKIGAAGQTIFGFITGDGDVTPSLASGASPSSQLPQSRQPLSMTIGDLPARIVFSGIVPGLIGVTQVNFTIPAETPAGVQQVVFSVGGVPSAVAKLTVASATK